MKDLKPAILALALGCAAPLALAQTTYGGSDSKMDSSTATAPDKCAGMTGAALDRCMAKNDKSGALGAGSPKASGRTGSGPSQEPSGGSDTSH